MEKIKKFIECLLPVTACNMKCSYCYVMQENRRAMKVPELRYDLDTIQYALRKDRFGGVCYFSICGAGETLIPQYVPELIARILENGHYVNVTSNGTLTKRYKELLDRCTDEMCGRLHFAFSLHWIELKRMHMIQRFFENVRMVRSAGCSIVIQMNMCDEYMPYIEEIKACCMKEVGALPQIAVTRREDGFPVRKVSLYTDGSEEAYIAAGREFKSPLFEYTLKNFRIKRKEFCYAGAWSYQLNLMNGLLKRCYCSCVVQNIFKDTKKPLFELAVGTACNSLYCNNSSHFMSQGIIPELDGPSYAELRNRPEAKWYTDEMTEVLSGKLADTNQEYGFCKRIISNFVGLYDMLAYRAYEKLLVLRNLKTEEGENE